MNTDRTTGLSPALGALLALGLGCVLVPTVVAVDVCYQSSNVLRLHALGVFLVLALSVTAAVLAGKAIRLNRHRWPLYAVLLLGSVLLFVYGFLAAQFALFGMCNA